MRFTPPDRFLRICGRDGQGRVEIGPRQIYILPTRYGLGFGLLLLLLLTGSINYANNLGFLFTFLLTGLGLVAMLHTWRNLVGLQIWSVSPTPVFAGQEAAFIVHLHNLRGHERPDIQLQLPEDQPRRTDLAAHAQASLTLRHPAAIRGLLRIPRCTVTTRYPLGLFHAWSYIELGTGCLVYPAPGPRLPPSDLPHYNPSQKGDRGVGADDFVGLRHYRPGDSPRHVNWKAAARGQGLQTKQFGGDRAERRWLEWETLPGLETESRLSALCRGVLDACDQQQEFGLRLPGETIKPGKGPGHRHQCLRALALYGKPS
jgi:uncharacterized protein (DUF58 family)